MIPFHKVRSSLHHEFNDFSKSVYYRIYNANSFSEGQIKEIPDQLLFKIFSHLDCQELQKQLEICRTWKQFANNSHYLSLYPKFLSSVSCNIFSRVFKYELQINPQFIIEAAKHEMTYDFAHFRSIAVDPEDVTRLINHPSLMLTLMKLGGFYPCIGDDLQKNESFLIEAIKENVNAYHMSYLSNQQLIKHKKTIIENMDPISILSNTNQNDRFHKYIKLYILEEMMKNPFLRRFVSKNIVSEAEFRICKDIYNSRKSNSNNCIINKK